MDVATREHIGSTVTALSHGDVSNDGSVTGLLLPRVYQWMAFGLGVSGATAMLVQTRASWFDAMAHAQWVLLLAVMVTSVGLGELVTRMPALVAFVVFVVFSVLMGAALSPVFARYTGESLAGTFFLSGGTFAVTSLYGHCTHREAERYTVAAMGLTGLVLATLIHLVLALCLGMAWRWIRWGTSCAGVLTFTILTAYGTRRIRERARPTGLDPPVRFAIQGATMLYLDFVYLFVFLLGVPNPGARQPRRSTD